MLFFFWPVDHGGARGSHSCFPVCLEQEAHWSDGRKGGGCGCRARSPEAAELGGAEEEQGVREPVFLAGALCSRLSAPGESVDGAD